MERFNFLFFFPFPQHSATVLPSVDRFNISHNATETGYFISDIVAVDVTNYISYKTEVNINYPESVFLCMVSAINSLGEGNTASTTILTNLILNGM